MVEVSWFFCCKKTQTLVRQYSGSVHEGVGNLQVVFTQGYCSGVLMPPLNPQCYLLLLTLYLITDGATHQSNTISLGEPKILIPVDSIWQLFPNLCPAQCLFAGYLCVWLPLTLPVQVLGEKIRTWETNETATFDRTIHYEYVSYLIAFSNRHYHLD